MLRTAHLRLAVALGCGALALGVAVLACGASAEDASTSTTPDAAATDVLVDVGDASKRCDRTGDDTENCGECARSCRGAACVDGVCAPTLIAANQNQPESIAVAANDVYWINFTGLGVLMHAAKDGTGPPAKLRDGLGWPLVSDGTRLFFVTLPSGGIVRCTPPACADEHVDDLHQHGPLAFDQQLLSAGAVRGDALDERTPTLFRVDPDTLNATAITPIPPYTYEVAARGGFVVWPESDGVVRGCRHESCAPRAFTPDGSLPPSVATDGKRVYWIYSRPGETLWACAVEGCAAPEAIATDQDFAGNLYVDGPYLYWTVKSHIVRCPSTGCVGEPLTIAVRTNAVAMTFDEQWIYWVDAFPDVGAISRAPK